MSQIDFPDLEATCSSLHSYQLRWRASFVHDCTSRKKATGNRTGELRNVANASGGRNISSEKAKATAANIGCSAATALAVCHSSEAMVKVSIDHERDQQFLLSNVQH